MRNKSLKVIKYLYLSPPSKKIRKASSNNYKFKHFAIIMVYNKIHKIYNCKVLNIQHENYKLYSYVDCRNTFYASLL